MRARADRERSELRGRRGAGGFNRLNLGTRRTLVEFLHELIERFRRAFGDDADRSIRLIGSPAGEPELACAADDEPAEPDARDQAPNGRLEPYATHAAARVRGHSS